MKKVMFFIIAFIFLFISGCSKGDNEKTLENELEKFNIKEILLQNINLNDENFLYAIGVNKDSKEVLLKYEKNTDNNLINIVEIINYDLNFSYQDLIIKIGGLSDKEFKNAIHTIIKNSKRIEIIDNAEIKEVLQINKKFNALAFFYEIDGTINKIVITYDLGDYYVANETTREIYYPIYINYNDFS